MDANYDPHIGKEIDSRKKIILFLIIIVFAFSIDIYTKKWAGSLFDENACPYPECSVSFFNSNPPCLAVGDKSRVFLELKKEVIPGFFYIHLLNNTGAAWSFLSGKNSWFIVFNVLFLITAFYYMLTPRKWNALIVISFSLIIGGAMGNFYDRLNHGSVRDFLSFLIPLPNGGVYHYPVFNFADMCICVGAGIYLLDQVILVRIRTKKQLVAKDVVLENANQ